MITDQQTTAVPSATRGRTQFTKPIQSNNAGRVAPAGSGMGQGQLNSVSNPVSERYNPIQAKSVEADQSGANTSTSDGLNSSLPYNTRRAVGLGGGALGGASLAKSDISQSNVDRAAAIIAEMDDDEAMELLNGIANGTIKNKGPKSQAMGSSLL